MFNIGLKSAGGGHYNHKPGGHLILFSLKLVVEFPPGSDAVICHVTHGNTPIQPGETCIQYCSGQLFHWVQYGFQTLKDLAKGNLKLKVKLDRRGLLKGCCKEISRG
jgi:hypothetical protein